jgi:hypothetical protein
MVDSKQVQQAVSVGELAIRMKKQWVTRNSLIQ